MGESWKHAKFVKTGILNNFIPTRVPQDTEDKFLESSFSNLWLCY